MIEIDGKLEINMLEKMSAAQKNIFGHAQKKWLPYSLTKNY